jgi:hypothetical protein
MFTNLTYLKFINIALLLSFIVPIITLILILYILGDTLNKTYWILFIFIGLIIVGIVQKLLKIPNNMKIGLNLILGLVIILFISLLIEKVTLLRILY